MPTQFTSAGVRNYVKIGTGFLAGFLASTGVSLYLQGNIATDRSLNTAPSLKLGTGSYMTYVDATCTATGGLQKYTSCYIANPFSGTASVVRTQIDVYKSGNSTNKMTVATTPIGNTTGTASTIIRYVSTSSGASIATESGTITGLQTNLTAPIILPGGGIRLWNTVAVPATFKAQLRVWLTQQYVP